MFMAATLVYNLSVYLHKRLENSILNANAHYHLEAPKMVCLSLSLCYIFNGLAVKHIINIGQMTPC